MMDLLKSLLDTVDAGRPVVVCRLVETRGSTPQKAGAMMLVFPDGSQEGTLGGGCVEAEVKRRALKVLAEGDAQIAAFQLDDDYGWDDGLICGGRMRILIDPLRNERSRPYFASLLELAQPGAGGATEAIVFDTEASGLPAPRMLLFDAGGRLVTHAGDSEGVDEAAVAAVENLAALSSRPRPSAVRGIAYLPTLPRCRLLIVGAGHVGQAVARLAAELDFEVWVVDDRKEFANARRFPHAERRIVGQVGEVLPAIEVNADTYCLIVTRGHNHDEEALYHLARRGARYVGMIGSKRKIRLIYDDLLAEGIPADVLAQVYAPLGVNIGSQTVPEIAVSICAELIAHRNLAGQVPGRPQPVLTTASSPPR